MMENPLKKDLDHILTHTEGLWDELRGQRIFITGGTGFFGCWMLESFAWANDRLGLDSKAVVLTRNPDAFIKKVPHLARYPAIQLYTGDVRSFEFPQGSFSHVLHMATDENHRLTVKDPLLMFDTIVNGAWHTLEFARQCNAKKFLLFGSGAVCGKQPADVTHISEEYNGVSDLMDQAIVYIEAKRVAELLCVQYYKQHGIECKIARGFTFIGPYLPLDKHFAIGNFIGDAIRGQPIQVKGDGTPYRSYLYAADAAIWLWAILCRGQACRPYNVGSEKGLTIAELAARVAGFSNPPGIVRISMQPTLGNPPDRYVPSTKRARTELGLQQYVELADAIKRTIEFNRAKM
jgi:dTDP-glucose 4,6-dehydratase